MSVRFERGRRKNNFQVKQVILNPNCPNHQRYTFCPSGSLTLSRGCMPSRRISATHSRYMMSLLVRGEAKNIVWRKLITLDVRNYRKDSNTLYELFIS